MFLKTFVKEQYGQSTDIENLSLAPPKSTECLILSLNMQVGRNSINQGFGAGAARSRGIWLEPEPSLWPGSTLIICLIIHEN